MPLHVVPLSANLHVTHPLCAQMNDEHCAFVHSQLLLPQAASAVQVAPLAKLHTPAPLHVVVFGTVAAVPHCDVPPHELPPSS
jgi:hypothetical protein